MRNHVVRVAAAQGFYGDSPEAAMAVAQEGNIDYLSFDALSELTLAILAKDQAKNSRMGYTKDLVPTMRSLLPLARRHGFKLLTNAGGINPEAAMNAVWETASQLGLKGMKIAVVTGDDVRSRISDFMEQGILGEDLEDGTPFSTIRQNLLFANVYLGSWPLVQALRMGADVVISGRTTDSAQFMAPLLYEFEWPSDDWSRLSQGVMMGHLLECSAQSTGGNFSGNWWDVPNMDEIGYPIAEVAENGAFVVTKSPQRGGLVTQDTIKEQMLYEIHDPRAYITPDVICDFTTAQIRDLGADRVEITGTTGRPAPNALKMVAGYTAGYMGQALIGYCWPDALKKAEKAASLIQSQIARRQWHYDEIDYAYLGWNSLGGPGVPRPGEELHEVYLRVSVRAKTSEDAAKLGRLFPPLSLDGPPGMGGGAGMQAPRQLLGMWSGLVPRTLVEPHVKVRIEEVE